jgi:Na+-translocating ferredoxin:NAD+ oxidoreductase RnfG subunit
MGTIDAITGATITSRAVTNAIESALTSFLSGKKGDSKQEANK